MSKPIDRPSDHPLDEAMRRTSVDKTSRALAKLACEKFWGEVTLKMKDGEIKLLTTKRDMLVEQLP